MGVIDAAGLTVDHLGVDRGGRPVLRDLSFHLSPGGAILVTGGNGVGKSTLLRALAGLIPRREGEVRLVVDSRKGGVPHLLQGSTADRATSGTDEPWRDPPPVGQALAPALRDVEPGAGPNGATDVQAVELAENTHYLGHANGLKLSLTAGENLRFYADWGGGRGAEPVAALDSVGLRHLHDVPAGVLSAGQRRRVALARLLVAPRLLWLLDEPATALDAASEGWLARLMRGHLAKGGLLLAAIHSPLDVPAREMRLGSA